MPPPRRIPSRSLIRAIVLSLITCLCISTPGFAFIWGEPLPPLPPVETSGPAPIATLNSVPTDITPSDMPTLSEVIPPEAPTPSLSSAPEPATLVAGLIGAAVLGVIGFRKKIRRAEQTNVSHEPRI